MEPQPRPLKVTLISAPKNPLGTLYYVWKQSRHNKSLPSPEDIEAVLSFAGQNKVGLPTTAVCEACRLLGFSTLVEGPGGAGASIGKDDITRCARHILDEIEMILNEGIPVVENLHFVFHLENIPISLREQLVRHRIGTAIDPRVGMDIVPVGTENGIVHRAGLMEMRTVPDLAESTWWSQTSRVINQGAFYDEGRWLLPESLEGKMCQVEVTYPYNATSQLIPQHAEKVYRDTLRVIQKAYNELVKGGVHIEDARQLIPVGATHGITWGLNLKAILHIFGKRSSWISQIGLWQTVMGQMASELRTKVHPMFGAVLMPQCIKQGRYVGCPVNGTNVERVQGTDGMPPCPLWVRYQTSDAIAAAEVLISQEKTPSWSPPMSDTFNGPDAAMSKDIRNWETFNPVETEMLNRAAEKYSVLWGFNVLEPPDSLVEIGSAGILPGG